MRQCEASTTQQYTLNNLLRHLAFCALNSNCTLRQAAIKYVWIINMKHSRLQAHRWSSCLSLYFLLWQNYTCKTQEEHGFRLFDLICLFCSLLSHGRSHVYSIRGETSQHRRRRMTRGSWVAVVGARTCQESEAISANFQWRSRDAMGGMGS